VILELLPDLYPGGSFFQLIKIAALLHGMV
jgi:hypothetical protein